MASVSPPLAGAKPLIDLFACAEVDEEILTAFRYASLRLSAQKPATLATSHRRPTLPRPKPALLASLLEKISDPRAPNANDVIRFFKGEKVSSIKTKFDTLLDTIRQTPDFHSKPELAKNFFDHFFPVDADLSSLPIKITTEIQNKFIQEPILKARQLAAFDVLLKNLGMRRETDPPNDIGLSTRFSSQYLSLIQSPSGRSRLAQVIRSLALLGNRDYAEQFRDILLQLGRRFKIPLNALIDIAFISNEHFSVLRDKAQQSPSDAKALFDKLIHKLPSHPLVSEKTQPVAYFARTGNQFADYLLGHKPNPNGVWLRDALNSAEHEDLFDIDSEFLYAAFPTSYGLEKILTTTSASFIKETSALFRTNPLLRASHRKVVDIALKKFGLVRDINDGKTIHRSLDFDLEKADWLKPENVRDRQTLQTIIHSLRLLGNTQIASNLKAKIFALLKARYPEKTFTDYIYIEPGAWIDIEDKSDEEEELEEVVATRDIKFTKEKTKEEKKITGLEKEPMLEPEHFLDAQTRRVAQQKAFDKMATAPSAAEGMEYLHNYAKSLYLHRLTSFPMKAEVKEAIAKDLQSGKFSSAKSRANSAYKSYFDEAQKEKEKQELQPDLIKYLTEQYEADGWDPLCYTTDTLGTSFINKLIPYNSLDYENEKGEIKNVFPSASKHQGISSASRETSANISNLWQSILEDSEGNQLFAGLRHASLSYQAKNKKSRKENQLIANAKAKELIRAALFLKHKDEIEKRLKDPSANKDRLKLDLVSTSLLTLKNFIIKPFLNEDEYSQFKQQNTALEELNHHIFTLNFGKTIIEVDLNVISFNFGVNNVAYAEWALPNIHGLAKDNWDRADGVYNQKSLIRLLGDPSKKSFGGLVESYLLRLKREPSAETVLKAAKITTLANEIKDIFNAKLHHAENGDRYAIARRIVYLSYLIGAVPAYNCKSGKDRTGAVDSEVKALAGAYSLQKTPEQVCTAPPNQARQAFYLDMGNTIVQQLNAYLTGNKVFCYHSDYIEKTFTPEQRAAIKGLAQTPF